MAIVGCIHEIYPIAAVRIVSQAIIIKPLNKQNTRNLMPCKHGSYRKESGTSNTNKKNKTWDEIIGKWTAFLPFSGNFLPRHSIVSACHP